MTFKSVNKNISDQFDLLTNIKSKFIVIEITFNFFFNSN